ncbi:NAD(P)/FAD-dependent oxidoreductase [Rivularia sp. UHCC 0363]|uniref:NAD(P)/FAD-dependent oxidoreductase n=1 Tax=Rivularia sp. UHCC 0363 TaxID=3110244 RepID=UPI002B1E9590|nr:NAD(P)/FAD-dependent oxidoreductase [Rivularia sp. UHCC 0363]MEA5597680.1 NAD(P)/FAD-dependent oxidoreductase [Rivularia sp. UHCC 0363]
MQPLKIVIVGGGAAGFFAAIAAAKSNENASVILLEASRQLLAKVRISGGGRCNVTHALFEPKSFIQNYPRGSKALLGAFSRFQAQDTVNWFASEGVKLKTEADGRMFPTTDSSETIVDCLIKTALAYRVQIRTGEPVVWVNPELEASEDGNRFEILLKSGEILRCDKLLLATGSNPVGYRIAKQLGHQVEPTVPSLFTFNILDQELRELAGVSVDPVQLRLSVPGKPQLEQSGPLLITHWGLSGPAVLKLSAWGARIFHESGYKATVTINWLPDFNQDQLRKELVQIKSEYGKRAIALHRGTKLPHRLWQYLISRAGIDRETRWAELLKKDLNKLVQELTSGQFAIGGKGVFKDEFVTCGGIKLKEVNFKTMESRLVKGLYFAGEILDIDGITGGFNFQSAWTTAYLAGLAMGQELGIRS